MGSCQYLDVRLRTTFPQKEHTGSNVIAWQGIGVFDSYCIDLFIINTESLRAIFLGY